MLSRSLKGSVGILYGDFTSHDHGYCFPAVLAAGEMEEHRMALVGRNPIVDKSRQILATQVLTAGLGFFKGHFSHLLAYPSITRINVMGGCRSARLLWKTWHL